MMPGSSPSSSPDNPRRLHSQRPSLLGFKRTGPKPARAGCEYEPCGDSELRPLGYRSTGSAQRSRECGRQSPPFPPSGAPRRSPRTDANAQARLQMNRSPDVDARIPKDVFEKLVTVWAPSSSMKVCDYSTTSVAGCLITLLVRASQSVNAPYPDRPGALGRRSTKPRPQRPLNDARGQKSLGTLTRQRAPTPSRLTLRLVHKVRQRTRSNHTTESTSSPHSPQTAVMRPAAAGWVGVTPAKASWRGRQGTKTSSW